MTADKRVADLIEIGERLAAALNRENAAIRGKRTAEVVKTVAEKESLTRLYETRLTGFRDALGGKPPEIDPPLGQKLKALGGRIQALVEENGALLRVAIEAHRRVVAVVVEAVDASRPAARPYGAAGGKAVAPAKGRPVAMSVDTSL